MHESSWAMDQQMSEPMESRYYHFCALRNLGEGITHYNDGVIMSSYPVDHTDFYDRIRTTVASNLDPPCSSGQIVILSLTPLDRQ